MHFFLIFALFFLVSCSSKTMMVNKDDLLEGDSSSQVLAPLWLPYKKSNGSSVAPVKNYKKEVKEKTSVLDVSGDGPPLLEETNIKRVANLSEPRPKAEVISSYGNPSSYKVDGISYRVRSYEIGETESGIGSWYGRKFHGRRTSSGEVFDMYQFSAAHRSMQIPAWVRVTNLKNGRNLIVRVNDRGPFVDDRIIDLSWAAAVKLGYNELGTAPVRIEILETPSKRADSVNLRLDKTKVSMEGPDIIQIIALSSLERARQEAIVIEKKIPAVSGKVRVVANETGIYRVQIVTKMTDDEIEKMILQLSDNGWQPTHLKATR